MQKPKSKAQVRSELEKQISHFLNSGGAVEKIPSGISGNSQNKNIFSSAPFNEQKHSRTPLSNLVKEIEARKKKKKEPIRARRQPKKRLITDDFGEPIRWEWEE